MDGDGVAPDLEIAELKKDAFRGNLAKFHADSSSLLYLLLQWKDLEQHYNAVHENIQRREEDLRLRELFKDQELGDLESKAWELDERTRELESDRERFDLDRRELDERAKEVELKEERVDEKEKQLGARSGELESDRRVLEADRGELDEQLREVESDRRALEVDRGKLDERLREVESQKKEFHTGMEKLNVLLRELDWRAKQLDGKERAIELRGRETGEQIKEPSQAVELKANQCEGDCRGIQSLRLGGCLAVDGKKLQVLLNECGEEHEKVRDEVAFLLKMSQDPARVVLDVMHGFFPPHLKKGDVEFEASTVRASCILLLEQLMKIAPDIKEDIESEAVKLSLDWMSKLTADSEHASQILGFLLLVAAYKLRKAFDDDKLITYAKVIAHWSQVPELCRKLGFRDEIDVVCSSPLISSPVSLDIPVVANNSSAEKATVLVELDTPLQQLQNVDHSQTAIFSQALQSAPADSNFHLQSLAPKSEQQKTTELTIGDDLPKEDVNEDVRGDGLGTLLSGDVEYKLVQKEVVNLLRSSKEPGGVVFDAIQGSPRSTSELGIPVRQAILLLNDLKQVISSIKPQLHMIATKFATFYKSCLKIRKNNPMGVIFLLQFSNVYKVSHDADEVISLLDSSIWCEGVPDSCQLLGLQDLIPDFITSLIKKDKGLAAIRYIVAMKLESSFSVTAILMNHLPFWEKKAQELLKGPKVTASVQMRAFKMRLDAARDAIKCISVCKLESIYPPKVFEEYMEKLEKQKSGKPGELEEASLCGLKRKLSECALEEGELSLTASSMVASSTPENDIESQKQTWRPKRKKKKNT